MIEGYLIAEALDFTYVYLVFADSIENAWRVYLRYRFEVDVCDDGYYRGPAVESANLGEVLSNYGLANGTKGEYIDPEGRSLRDMEAVKEAYCIVEAEAGHVFSRGPAYATLADALANVPGAPVRIGIAKINNRVKVQQIATLGLPYGKEFGHPDLQIAGAHREQAERYIAVGQYSSAIREFRNCNRLSKVRSTRFWNYFSIAQCYVELGHPDRAIKEYMKALASSTEFDKRDLVRYNVARLFDSMTDEDNAIIWYRQINEQDLDDEAQVAIVKERIKEIAGARRKQ